MTMKRFSCRTHGGIFTKESARGRPPVRCTPEYPCDRANATQASDTMRSVIPDFAEMSNAELKAYARENFSTISKITSRAQLISAMEKQLSSKPQVTSVVREVPGVGKVAVVTSAPAESSPKPQTATNDSLASAMRAKEQLEDVGWVVKGKAWFGDAGEHIAEVAASRGAEMLIMQWLNGVLSAQDYSMEHLRPSENGLPGRKLNFDPEELTDRELVQKISGMKVTWWNTLASSTESAIVPGDKVRVEHIFRGGGDEDNSKRIVTFVDRDAGGFRSFYVGALMKVG